MKPIEEFTDSEYIEETAYWYDDGQDIEEIMKHKRRLMSIAARISKYENLVNSLYKDMKRGNSDETS